MLLFSVLFVHPRWRKGGARLEPGMDFGLKTTEAKKILREVFTAVSGWRNTGRRLRLKALALDAYASAFEHPLINEARQLLGR